ncbi:hypothetical protein [Serratia liquefaciens]|uniref:hypothetical protein n=1 Tax=Serratia liquefaciens TaxID=614 RepID=UPI00059B7572|nr:hypothetical protein [Serratia liquefaciens]
MALLLVDQNATIVDSDFIISPVMNGLMGHNILGGTLAQSKKNGLRGAGDLSVVGSPTISSNYVSFTGTTAYMQSALMQQPQHTLICVARSSSTFADAAHQPMFISTFSGQNVDYPVYSTQGLSMYVANSGFPAPKGKLTAISGAYPTATPANATAKTQQIDQVDFSSFRLFILDQSTTGITINDITGATANIEAPYTAGTASARSTRPFAIGGPANPVSYTGVCDIAYWAIYNRTLTSTEKSSIITWLRAYYSSVGINI